MKDFIVVAHRGGKGPHPENTLEAFEHAIKQGAKAIEMDLRFDYLHKRFFIEHDFFHHPMARFNLLEQTVEAIPADVMLVVELKIARVFSSYFFVKHFADFYKKKLSGRKLWVQSFNPFALKRLRRLLPNVDIGFLCGNPFWNFIFQRFFFASIKPQLYLLHRRVFSKKNIAFGKKHNLKIVPFVLNKKEQWDKAIEQSVHGIITDVPQELNRYIAASV